MIQLTSLRWTIDDTSFDIREEAARGNRSAAVGSLAITRQDLAFLVRTDYYFSPAQNIRLYNV